MAAAARCVDHSAAGFTPYALARRPPHGWSPNTLTADNDLLRALMPSQSFEAGQIPGVTTPNCYVGLPGTMFMMHAEDQNLASCSLLVAGHPKVWFVVPPAYYPRLVEAIRHEFRAERLIRECPQAIMHKRFLLHPDRVRKVYGIPVSRIVQRPGDLMITAPGAFHWGYNAGINLAEATNLAWAQWWTGGAYRACVETGACTCTSADRFKFDNEALLAQLQLPALRAHFGIPLATVTYPPPPGASVGADDGGLGAASGSLSSGSSAGSSSMAKAGAGSR